jgi:hypothetical protein
MCATCTRTTILRGLLDEKNHVLVSKGKFNKCQALYWIRKISLRDCGRYFKLG